MQLRKLEINSILRGICSETLPIIWAYVYSM